MVHVALLDENEERQIEFKEFVLAQPELSCSFACCTAEEFQQLIGVVPKVHILLVSIHESTIYKFPPSLIRKWKDAHPGMEIMILTDYPDFKKVISWLKAGVVGCLSRETPMWRIKEAILGIYHGEAHIDPLIIRQMLDFFQKQKDFEIVLTEREIEVVQCLVEGLSYKLIACKLNVALDTVRFHLRNIYKKLHVNSKAEVITKAASAEWNV